MQSGTRNDGAHAPRRTRDVVLLVLNVTIFVLAIGLVWAKLRDRAGLDGTPPPLDTPPPPAARGAESPPPTPHATAGDPSPEAGTVVAPGGEGPGADDTQPPPPEPRLRGQVDAEVRGPHPGLEAARRREELHAVAATEAAIDRVGVDVEVLRAIRGAYPSSAAPYGTNRGIEALHAALAKVGKTSGLRIGDTDEDGRLEILDAWGRPLVWFSPEDYASVQRWAPGDGAARDVEARRSAASGAFLAAGTYQLWSAGPDGSPGSDDDGDDVTSWVSRD